MMLAVCLCLLGLVPALSVVAGSGDDDPFVDVALLARLVAALGLWLWYRSSAIVVDRSTRVMVMVVEVS